MFNSYIKLPKGNWSGTCLWTWQWWRWWRWLWGCNFWGSWSWTVWLSRHSNTRRSLWWRTRFVVLFLLSLWLVVLFKGLCVLPSKSFNPTLPDSVLSCFRPFPSCVELLSSWLCRIRINTRLICTTSSNCIVIWRSRKVNLTKVHWFCDCP